MTSNDDRRTGGRVLVDQLVTHGVSRVFCVPGESYLEILDALHDSAGRIELVNARHEAGAANMAEAFGKLTGQPGICLVTRGPGACHAAVGVHTAFQDSTPMILFVGQVARPTFDREGFQEIDYRQMFAKVAKWVAQIESAERIPEYVARAFRVATSGRPGPVVLSVPEDVLEELVSLADAPPYQPVQPAADPAAFESIRAMLSEARKPIVLVGGSGWSDEAALGITRFVQANGLPVCSGFRRQDIVDNGSSSYVGDLGTSGPPGLIARVRDADLILVVGARLGEMTSQGYSLVDAANPAQTFIHIHVDPNEIGRVYSPALGISSSVGAVAAVLGEASWFSPREWADWRAAARRDYLDSLAVPPFGGALDLARIFADLDAELPPGTIVALDAGNHTGWPQRFLRYGRLRRQLGSTSGAMGYAVPAAVSASLLFPDRCVLACVGDGGFAMSGLELMAAVQHGATPIVLVFNNGMYGTIRMHQERHHPGRVVGTDLANPDFVTLAGALGLHAERVERTEEFASAFRRARQSGKPALIELRTSAEQLSSRLTISQLRSGGSK